MKRPLAAALVACALLQGCATSGLSFVQDDRVRILQPVENAKVRLPFELRWESKGFTGSYLVLFDRSPMRPDRTVLSLVPEDDPCRSLPGCPDTEWLGDRDIYVTKATSLLVEGLPDRRVEGRTKDIHEVTIVLLDEEGRRVGESAFFREFVVERED